MKAALLALTLVACATVPNTLPGPSAAIGQTALVDGLAIRPLALLEDSRCPASVQCIWAGQVRIRVMISPLEQVIPSGPNAPATMVARELDLTLGKSVSEFGRMVTLSSATPAVAVPGKIDQGAYRFTFTVERPR